MSGLQRVVVLITAPPGDAGRIARTLVEEKLAACVNVVEGVRSIYWWQGRVEEDGETLLVAKTLLSLMPRLIERVKEIHPYTVPEIIALPIIAGNPEYLAWMEESTRAGGEER